MMGDARQTLRQWANATRTRCRQQVHNAYLLIAAIEMGWGARFRSDAGLHQLREERSLLVAIVHEVEVGWMRAY
jgi:hypothetical protein